MCNEYARVLLECDAVEAPAKKQLEDDIDTSKLGVDNDLGDVDDLGDGVEDLGDGIEDLGEASYSKSALLNMLTEASVDAAISKEDESEEDKEESAEKIKEATLIGYKAINENNLIVAAKAIKVLKSL